MARVPVISSPCPLRWANQPQPGRDFCGQCQRRVHNLDLMSEADRTAFLNACSGDVCVSYTVRRTRSIPAALSIGVMALTTSTAALAEENSSAAAAPETAKFNWGQPTGAECPPTRTQLAGTTDHDLIEIIVMEGGVKAGEQLQWIDESEANVPDKAVLPEIAASDWLPTPKT
jgi:hypothetical protein